MSHYRIILILSIIFTAFLAPISPAQPTVNTKSTNSVYSYTIYSYVCRISESRRDIPIRIYLPLNRPDPAPIILFSNGLGASNDSCTYLPHTWAKNGFCVISIAHPGSDEKHLPHEAYRKNWSARTRTKDIISIINKIEHFAQSDDKFINKIDTSRIGASGYDLGALSALLLAGQLPPDNGSYLYDDRIKAVLPMSPPVQTKHSFTKIYAPITIPALFFTGTDDNGIIGNTKAHERRIPYDYISSYDRYLITFLDADHLIYTGHTRLIRLKDDEPYQRSMCRLSTTFWKAYLDNDEASLNTMQQNRLKPKSLQ